LVDSPPSFRDTHKEVKMKKTVILLGFAILTLELALAAPDFSGGWVLDKAKSDPTRGAAGSEQPDVTLVIKQSPTELQVGRTMSRGGRERTLDQKIPLDGKQFTSQMGQQEFTGKASWSGENLVVEGTQTTQRGETKTKIEYALSDGGKVLTISTTNTTPQGERTRKEVYNKK
jgi:hypothetical protein